MTKIFFQYTLLILILFSLFEVVSGQGRCIGMTPCYCKYENGQFLQLAGLARTDGLPRFVNISDTHEISYSWNPCFNFTEGGCDGVAMCAIESSFPHDLYLDIGEQSTAKFVTNMENNSVSLVYKTQTKPVRTSHVLLTCIREDLKDEYFSAYGPIDQTSTDYYFELRSPLACPQGNPVVSTTQSSTGTDKRFEIPLIVVSAVAFILAVALFMTVLKMKGKFCKGKDSYDPIN